MGYPSSSEYMEDVDGWELLAGDGSLDGGRGELIPIEAGIDHGALLDASYFLCAASPSHPPPTHPTKGSERTLDLLAVDENKLHETEPAEEIQGIPVVDVSVVKEVIGEKVVVEESKFVDMKVADLPLVGKDDLLEEPFKSKVENDLSGCESVAVKDACFVGGLVEEEKSSSGGGGGGGFGIWGWRVTGLGALCSLGIAAATICIIVLGRQRQIQHPQQQSQKFRFNSCADDSRMKNAVRQASRLNQAMSAIRGVPFTGAQITFGGYYNGL